MATIYYTGIEYESVFENDHWRTIARTKTSTEIGGPETKREAKALGGYDAEIDLMKLISRGGKDVVLPVKKPKPKVIYIAHPIGGDVPGNLIRIMDIARTLNLNGENIIPFAPYFLDVHCLDDDNPEERARGIQNDVFWLNSGMIDEVHLYGDRISPGMLEEVKLAVSLGILVWATTPETVKELKEFYLSQ